MKKILALLALVILVLLVARQTASLPGAPPGAPAPLPSRLQFQVPQEGKGCSVPKAWGDVKGVADRAIAFVDSTGTIRVLDVGPCERGQTQLVVLINRQ